MSWPRQGNVIYADFGRENRDPQPRESLAVPREREHGPAAQRFFDAGTYDAEWGRLQRGLKSGGLELADDPTVTNGRVEAQILGSRGAVYQVRANLPLRNAQAISHLLEQVTQTPDTLRAAVHGELSDDVVDILLGGEEEILFSCSCPDSAYRCKHIIHFSEAFASKLDSDPSLPFRLRGIDLYQLEQTVGVSQRGNGEDTNSWNPERYWEGTQLPPLPVPRRASALASSNVALLTSALQTVSRGKADTERAVQEITQMYEVLIAFENDETPGITQ